MSDAARTVVALEEINRTIREFAEFLRSARLETEGEMYARMLGKKPASEGGKAECCIHCGGKVAHEYQHLNTANMPHVPAFFDCKPAQPEPASTDVGIQCLGCGDAERPCRCEGYSPEPVAHEDAEFMRDGSMAMARIIERDEQPEPVAADTFATDRAIGAQVADASALEPVAEEMPEAVESLLGILATRIDALDHSWRPWYQPVKEAMARVRQARATPSASPEVQLKGEDQ